MTISLTALHAFLADARNLQQFKRLDSKVTAASPRESMALALLPMHMEDTLKSIEELATATRVRRNGVTALEDFIEGKWYGYTPKAVKSIADIQATLITLFRNPALYAQVQAACPALAELEQAAPLGWEAYDELLNAQGNDRCFGERPTQPTAKLIRYSLPGRGSCRIHVQEKAFDAIYIRYMGLYWYAERIALPYPERPRSFGEELRILDRLGTQALDIFDQCAERGRAFHDNPPKELRIEYREQYKKAVTRNL